MSWLTSQTDQSHVMRNRPYKYAKVKCLMKEGRYVANEKQAFRCLSLPNGLNVTSRNHVALRKGFFYHRWAWVGLFGENHSFAPRYIRLGEGPKSQEGRGNQWQWEGLLRRGKGFLLPHPDPFPASSSSHTHLYILNTVRINAFGITSCVLPLDPSTFQHNMHLLLQKPFLFLWPYLSNK